jgi:hypothetical protein
VSAITQVRWLRDRPIAERERRATIAGVAVLLLASAVLFTASMPAGRTRHPAPRKPVASANGAPRSPIPEGGTASDAAASRTAHDFLAGYLAYLYGHAPASAVIRATQALSHSLLAHPPIVSPGVLAHHPRVLSLRGARAPLGLIGVSALVNDGELASYRVRLILTRTRGRLLVIAVEGA